MENGGFEVCRVIFCPTSGTGAACGNLTAPFRMAYKERQELFFKASKDITTSAQRINVGCGASNISVEEHKKKSKSQFEACKVICALTGGRDPYVAVHSPLSDDVCCEIVETLLARSAQCTPSRQVAQTLW